MEIQKEEIKQPNGPVAQEVSSTTLSVGPAKRSLRVETWKKIGDNKCGVGFNNIFNRIPSFVDSEKAAALFAELDEFKKAQTIKVSIDRALYSAKLESLKAGKTLYLPGTRQSNALFLKVDVVEDATAEQMKEILNVQDVQKHRTEISLDSKVNLDLVVVGSVLVSRDGHHIGRGNGFTDLAIGLLVEIGAITDETLIVTLVHDLQVVDTLPADLFQKYDTPIDIIVTPTEVIRVEKRLPRPTGIFWDLLSERRLKIIPVLQELKEKQEKEGKIISLKDEDTDVEQNKIKNRVRQRNFGRRYQRRPISQTDAERRGGGSGGTGGTGTGVGAVGGIDNSVPKRNPRRKFINRRRRLTKSEGDQSGVESKNQEVTKPVTTNVDKKPKPRKNIQRNDFCIRVSNITRGVRVKDLKSELRKRECHPLYITWKGQFGKCYLYFGNRKGEKSTEEEINKVLKSLDDLTLTINTGGEYTSGAEGDNGSSSVQQLQTKTVSVTVELLKFDESNNEPTKRSLREFTWKLIQDKEICRSDDTEIINKMPDFIDSESAAERFLTNKEFDWAKHIVIANAPALQGLKKRIALSFPGKYIYVPGAPDSNVVLWQLQKTPCINAKLDSDDEEATGSRIEIGIDTKMTADIVVIGSVVVSRDGHRIGSGRGSTNLELGLLTELGIITHETLITTIVHDVQVVDTLPAKLFKKYDAFVDVIYTPTEEIHINNDRDYPLPRIPICWDLLSERRLKSIPVLQQLKEREEKAGKVINLKEELSDTDPTTTHQKYQQRGGYMGPRYFGRFQRPYQRRAASQTDTDHRSGNNALQKRQNVRRPKFVNKSRRPTKSEGDDDQSSYADNKNKDVNATTTTTTAIDVATEADTPKIIDDGAATAVMNSMSIDDGNHAIVNGTGTGKGNDNDNDNDNGNGNGGKDVAAIEAGVAGIGLEQAAAI